MTRELWSTDLELVLHSVIDRPVVVRAFKAWLRRMAPDDVLQVDIVHDTEMLQRMPPADAAKLASIMCQQYLASDYSGEAALAAMRDYARETCSMLAERRFPKFLASTAGLQAIEHMLEGGEEELERRLWPKYEVPDDVSSWLSAFVIAAETFPCAIGLSDGALPGSPLCYVNPAFCRMTRYSPQDVLGRDANCRFLYGPQSDDESIGLISEALRTGGEAQVDMTNYRRGDEAFDTLLTLRPVHDTNGAFRFAVAVWMDVTDDKVTTLTARASRISKLVKSLPKALKVPEAGKGRPSISHGQPELAKMSTVQAIQQLEGEGREARALTTRISASRLPLAASPELKPGRKESMSMPAPKPAMPVVGMTPTTSAALAG